MVITFDRHPRQVLQSEWQPCLLTTLDEKLQLLERTGIDYVVVLSFDVQMAMLTAHDFMQQVLLQRLGVRLLLTGYDNHFGRRTADDGEGFSDYVAYGREMGIEVVCGQPLIVSGQAVSSSMVRRLLSQGQVDRAADFLGRPYCLSGTVVHGLQNGHLLGYPTANLSVEAQRMVPAAGVYAVKVHLSPTGDTLPGMTNIGTRPTFGGHLQTIETHILDFDGDLYGRWLSIDFMSRLRPEQSFGSPEELARQMALDAAAARSLLTINPQPFPL